MKSLGYPIVPGLTLSLAVLLSAACSSPFVAGSGGSGTGGSGSTSTTGTTSGSTSGTGGAATCPSTCPAEQYCNPQSGACESCTTSTRFSFGTPTALPLMLPMPGASALYPRVDDGTGDLYLVQQQPGATHLNQLAMAMGMMGQADPWTSATLMSQLTGTHQDSGPFPLQDPSQLGAFAPDAISKQLGMPVLLFDSDRNGGRHVFAIGYQQASPTELTLPGAATDESRLVAATGATPVRFFWISNLGTTTYHLVTSTVASNDANPVAVTLDTGCVTPLPDTPWVTPAGDRILFSSLEYTAGTCTAASAITTHLYHVVVDASGQPLGKAQRLFPNDDSTDTTPALSTDHCELLFARLNPSGVVGLYAASRD